MKKNHNESKSISVKLNPPSKHLVATIKNPEGEEKSKLASFIVFRRLQLGMNQVELAKESGLSSGTIASIESGYSSTPKPDTLEKLAKGLKTTYEELDCIIRDVLYKPNVGSKEPLRDFENYLLSNTKVPKEVAENLLDIVRMTIRKYE